MDFNLTDLSGFSDIGTIVYYRERPFFPEILEVSEDLLPYSYSGGCMYSTSLTSEYVDFAKTGFTFGPNPPQELLPNLFDFQDTYRTIGSSDFDSPVSVAFPGLSSGVEDQGKHFFGKLVSPKEISYLAYLPVGVWKVEVYNSRIDSNCGAPGSFIDYDVLVKQGGEILEAPVLTVYFGPKYNTQIQDYSYREIFEKDEFPLYKERYTLPESGEVVLSEEEYPEFKKYVMTKSEYLKSYREEIQSEKILYLVNTPEGKMDSVNFYSLAYPVSHDPHPHLQEYVLKNDALWYGEHPVTKTYDSGVVVDSRSGVLLGLRSLSKAASSWARGALETNYGYSKSSSARRAKVNGKRWTRCTREEVFGENPEISPFWYSPDEMPDSIFKHYYITAQGKGFTSPSGLVYLVGGKDLEFETVEAEKGYRYDGFRNVRSSEISTWGGGKVTIKTNRFPRGYKFEAIFSEIEFTLNFQIDCLRDYPGNSGNKMTYNLSEIGSPGGYNYSPLSRTNIKLIYLSEDGKELTYGTPESIYSRKNPPVVSDSRDFYFRLDDTGTGYSIKGKLTYSDGSEIHTSGDWYVLRVGDFPSSVLGAGSTIIPIGEIVPRKYTVSIISKSGIQISTPKRITMEYHNMDPSSPNPVDRPFETKMILGPDDTVEVWREGEISKPGLGAPWTLTEGSDGVWTFRIPLIENNYKIIIK